MKKRLYHVRMFGQKMQLLLAKWEVKKLESNGVAVVPVN